MLWNKIVLFFYDTCNNQILRPNWHNYRNNVNIWVSAKNEYKYKTMTKTKKMLWNKIVLFFNLHIIAIYQRNWWTFKIRGIPGPYFWRVSQEVYQRVSQGIPVASQGPFFQESAETWHQIILRNHTRQISFIFDHFWMGRFPQVAAN